MSGHLFANGAAVDLVNPVGAGRRLVGWGGPAGLDEARPISGKPLAQTLDQHGR
jgi:hypothetical protein